MQIVDVLDLADFVLLAGLGGRSGPVNVVGEATSFQEALDLADGLTAGDGPPVKSDVCRTRNG